MAVYVLIDRTRTCCKIGYSKDMASAEKRVKGLQTASPYGLQVLCVNQHLNVSDEQHIHKQLDEHRTGGGTEWFDYTTQKVVDCVEYVKTATESMFPEAVEKKQKPKKEQAAKCTCDCPHVTQEQKDEDVYGCPECADTWDQNGECAHCIYERSRLGEHCDSYKEFVERCNEIAVDDYLNPAAWTVRRYLTKQNECDLKPITVQECFELLIAGTGQSFGDKCRVAELVFRLSEYVWDENDNGCYPCLFDCNGDLAVLLEGEFAGMMEEAEFRYIESFWDVDECGLELFLICVNKARDIKKVPYGIWRD